jgi:membrane associated rhomboid family serine protease
MINHRHNLGIEREFLLVLIVVEATISYFFFDASSHTFGAIGGLLSGLIFLKKSETLKLFDIYSCYLWNLEYFV